MTGLGIILFLGLTILGYVILYQIIKAAVRNGYVEGRAYMMPHEARPLKNTIKEGVKEALDECKDEKNEGGQQ